MSEQGLTPSIDLPSILLAEGLIRASLHDPAWLTDNNVIRELPPAWLSNHEVATGFFCAVQDYGAALTVLERLCPLMGVFIEDTKMMSLEERRLILDRFIALCGRIADFRVLWGVEATHTRRVIIQMHRRCTKLVQS